MSIRHFLLRDRFQNVRKLVNRFSMQMWHNFMLISVFLKYAIIISSWLTRTLKRFNFGKTLNVFPDNNLEGQLNGFTSGPKPADNFCANKDKCGFLNGFVTMVQITTYGHRCSILLSVNCDATLFTTTNMFAITYWM